MQTTAVEQYQSYLQKADVVPTIDVTELATLRERAQGVVVNDITNEAEMALAKKMRKELSEARIEISKTAKLARDEFTVINRGIREVELALLSEFEEEEERLKGYEDQLKAKRLRDERMLVLPVRKERLKLIDVEMPDEDLLAMDDLQFSNFLAEKQEAILMEKKRKEEDDARIKAAEEAAADRARKEVEDEAKRKAEEKEREHQAEIERLEKEKKDAELQEKAKIAEAYALAKEKKYKQFLKDNGYNDKEFITVDEGNAVILYRVVAVYTK
jgi:hypothetical protein